MGLVVGGGGGGGWGFFFFFFFFFFIILNFASCAPGFCFRRLRSAGCLLLCAVGHVCGGSTLWG